PLDHARARPRRLVEGLERRNAHHIDANRLDRTVLGAPKGDARLLADLAAERADGVELVPVNADDLVASLDAGALSRRILDHGVEQAAELLARRRRCGSRLRARRVLREQRRRTADGDQRDAYRNPEHLQRSPAEVAYVRPDLPVR